MVELVIYSKTVGRIRFVDFALFFKTICRVFLKVCFQFHPVAETRLV